MRVPSYSTVLGIAAAAGLAAFGYTLARELPSAAEIGVRRSGFRAIGRPVDEDGLRAQLASRPDDAQAWLDLGKLLATTGRPDEARVVWRQWGDTAQRALDEQPEQAWWWYCMGWSRAKLGEVDGARAAWNHAAELYRNATRGQRQRNGLYNLACCLALYGDTEGALSALDEAVKAGWDNPDHAREDADLESLRDDPRFEAIVQRMPGRIRIQGG
jgi:Flp pilus assembly protein TadD